MKSRQTASQLTEFAWIILRLRFTSLQVAIDIGVYQSHDTTFKVVHFFESGSYLNFFALYLSFYPIGSHWHTIMLKMFWEPWCVFTEVSKRSLFINFGFVIFQKNLMYRLYKRHGYPHLKTHYFALYCLFLSWNFEKS